MEKKTISINPDLFSMGKKKRGAKKKTKKNRPKPLIKPNVMQKELLKRIKQHQSKTQETMELPKPDENITHSEFDKHLDYLTKLKQEKKNEKLLKKKRKKEKNKKVEPPSIEINTPTLNTNVENIVNKPFTPNVPVPPVIAPVLPAPPVLPDPPVLPAPPVETQEISVEPKKSDFVLPSAPPYSCLKGSSIPTYREWKKNTRKNLNFKDSVPINEVKNMDIADMTVDKPSSSKRKLKKKKYTKRVYTLGKTKESSNVGVLIKSNSDRRVVQEEIDKLKNVTIKEVKDYLRKHCLIKVGSNAPNDVLRKMYEDSILSGEINNKTKGTLLHNYMNE
tara:strand:- start:15604 stop:16605 length:1002 start_codon:yes stop_codon:yes gene_type:complete